MVITREEEFCDSLTPTHLVQTHLSLHSFANRLLYRKDVLHITWSHFEKTMWASQFQAVTSQLETLFWHYCSFSPFYYDDFRFSKILPSLKLVRSDCWCLLKIKFSSISLQIRNQGKSLLNCGTKDYLLNDNVIAMSLFSFVHVLDLFYVLYKFDKNLNK